MATIPSGIIIAWVTGASIPTNWSRVTTMDDRFGKGTTGSPAPNAETVTPTHIHDSAAHTHPASHNHTGTTPAVTTATGNPIQVTGYNFPNALAKQHTHTYTIGSASLTSSSTDHGNWDAGSSNPAFYAVRWIQSNGSPTGFPDDSVAFFNDSTPPTGWGQHAASKDRFIIGCADGEDTTDGATGGGGTHTHAVGAHTHTAGAHTHGGVTSANQTESGYLLATDFWSADITAAPAHSHAIAAYGSGGSVTSGAKSGGTSGTYTYEPTYYTVLGIENTSGSDSAEEGIIVGWLGTIGNIPDEWILCDGDNDTPDLDGKFLKMANATSEVDDTGGTLGHSGHSSAGHTHTNTHTHTGGTAASTVTGQYSNVNATAYGNLIVHWNDHPHAHGTSTSSQPSSALTSTSPTLSSTTNTEPANRTMAWLQYQPEDVAGNAMMFGANF